MQSVLIQRDESIDRSNGNGSSSTEDDWLDINTTASENEWSTAQTIFYTSDAPPHMRERFESLRKMNDGWGEYDRVYTIRRSHIIKDAETFASILGLPKPQKKRVVDIATEIDLQDKFGTKSYEKILLAICSLTSDKALSSMPNPSIEQRIVFTDEFNELLSVNNMTRTEHTRVRQMVRERTDYF